MSTVALPEPARSRPGRLLRTLSDERLVARIRSGDEAAFEVVYDRYHRDLLSFCRHMLGSREEAEDALQHACISAYQALQRDDRPIQLKAWLFAIARNRCLTMLRARREHADVDDVQPSVEGLASEVQRREDLREMLADLQRLPEDQRAALVLSELGAHSHEEVAMILDVRKEKVKALVFQAREQLIGARKARDTDCAVIREQLATLRGGALRRTELRRHVDACPGCAEFKQEVQRQRAAMAVMLPVIPGVALKGSVLSAVFTGGSGGALAAGGGAVAAGGGAGAALTGGGGMFAGLGAQGLAVKALAVLAVAGGAGGTGYVVVDELRADPAPPVTVAPAVAPAAAPTTSGTRPASGPASTSADPTAVTATGKAKGRARRGAGAPGRSGAGGSGNGAAANGKGSAASAAAGGNAGGSATAKAKGRGKPSGTGATRRSSKATTKKSTSRSRRSAQPRRTTAVKAEPKAKRTAPATPPKSSKPAEPPGPSAKDPKSTSAPAASDQAASSGQGSGAGAGSGDGADPAGGTPTP